MLLYKITIRPLSSYCSPLQSDTFFGAFCWSYLYEYGEDALNSLIDNYKNGKPDIIFSNAFPSGQLPMPAQTASSMKNSCIPSTKLERYQKYIADKKRKQAATIPLYMFNQIITDNMDSMRSMEAPLPEQKTDIHMEWRNIVSRLSNKTENINNTSSLFEATQYFTDGTFDIYISSTFDPLILETVLKSMFRYGIGAQRSVGKGAFEMEGGVKIFHEFQTPSKPNAFVALSNFVPHKNDPVYGYYKAFVKYPKLSNTTSSHDSPFKKPLIFLKAGSVFKDSPVREFYGSCIQNIALQNGTVSSSIIIGAYTIAIPCFFGGI